MGAGRAGLRTCATLAAALALAACHSAPPPRTTPASPPSALIQLEHDLDAVLESPVLQPAYWGVLAQSLKTGDTLYSLNPHKLLMPASTMKIVTMAAAAARLGWDYTYETRLFAAGPIEGGVLHGDLVIVGSGDPSIVADDGMATRLFGDWADRLKSIGVRSLNGRVVGDDQAFDDEGLGFGWSWDDLTEGFAASISALQFNFNTVQVTIAPGPGAGAAALVSLTPDGSGLVVDNRVRTEPAGIDRPITARRLPGSAALELGGSVALGAPPSVRVVSVDNPTLFFVTSLRDALVAHGIDVRGPAVDIDEAGDLPSRDQARLLVSHRSPPLSALAQTLMKESQNLYAETFLKTLGVSTGGATSESGRRAASAILQEWGIAPAELIQMDGSGLSRYDYVTADALVRVLTHINGEERMRSAFEASLPIAGRDGTLAGRMKGTAAEGNARAKTGSMSNVRALAGYVTTADGEPVVFSILANNFNTSADEITRAIDAIVVRLARFQR